MKTKITFILMIFFLINLPSLLSCQVKKEKESKLDTLKYSEKMKFTDEEIKRAMNFSTTAKITSIFIGTTVGGFIGGSFVRLVRGKKFDEVALAGIVSGMIIGGFLNYKIISKLARNKAKRKLVKDRENNQHTFINQNILIYANMNSISNNQYLCVGISLYF